MSSDDPTTPAGPPPAYPAGYDYGHRGPAREPVAEAADLARRAGPELVALVVTVVALLVAGAVNDEFQGGAIWTAVAIVSAAYILSRGLAQRR